MSELADVMNEAEDLECCQHCQNNILEWLTSRGYHVVTEGQAVVDGQVWAVEKASFRGPMELRPLTDPPPPPDETTSTTTTTVSTDG